MEVPETRYARSGEVHVAYQAFGDGPLDLVFVPGVISNVEIAWHNPLAIPFFERLSSLARVIWFDKRGTGVSDPVEGVPTLDARMDDVRAVMDAAGSGRAALMGVSEGGPMTILFAATYPERTAALVLFGTAAKTVRAHDYPWGATLEEAFRTIEQTERHWGETEFCDAALRRLAPSIADDPELKRWWRTYIRVGASPATATALQRMNMEIDVRHVLPAIACRHSSSTARTTPTTSGRAGPGARHDPFHGHRRLHDQSGGARRYPLARAASRALCARAGRARPVPRAGDRRRRRRDLRELRRPGPRRPLRASDRGGRARARARDPRRVAHRRVRARRGTDPRNRRPHRRAGRRGGRARGRCWSRRPSRSSSPARGSSSRSAASPS